MAKRILAVLGSHRRTGNSAALLDEAIRSARAQGVLVEKVELSRLAFLAHCTGCDACKSSCDHLCVAKDGLNDVIDLVRRSDGLVVACPVFFFSYNSLTKAFIDRLFYSSELMDGGNLLAGKHIGLIVTHGRSDVIESGASNVLQAFQDLCTFCGLRVTRMVRGQTTEKDGPGRALVREAQDLGRSMSQAVIA